jgi:proline dehydrogenase
VHRFLCRYSARKEFPTSPIRNLIFWLSTKKDVTRAFARAGVRHGFARRFVAGETLDDALRVSAEICRSGRRVSLNELGEHLRTAAQAERARNDYIRMIHALDGARLDGNVSIKLTELGLDFNRELCLSFANDIACAAKAAGHTIEVDMEGSAYTQATVEIFEAVQRRHGNGGLAIQSYLRRSEADIERLAPLHPKIRLVKGAYREPVEIAFQKKKEVDDNFRRLLDRLLAASSNGGFVTAVATHDPALVEYALEKIRTQGLETDRYEFQMIYGIRRDLQDRVHAAGHPLRIYVPFGTAWLPYFMRRLAERPANLWFVLRSLLAERSG